MKTRSAQTLVHDLREFIAALDRRVPSSEREGEGAIARDAQGGHPANDVPVLPGQTRRHNRQNHHGQDLVALPRVRRNMDNREPRRISGTLAFQRSIREAAITMAAVTGAPTLDDASRSTADDALDLARMDDDGGRQMARPAS